MRLIAPALLVAMSCFAADELAPQVSTVAPRVVKPGDTVVVTGVSLGEDLVERMAGHGRGREGGRRKCAVSSERAPCRRAVNRSVYPMPAKGWSQGPPTDSAGTNRDKPGQNVPVSRDRQGQGRRNVPVCPDGHVLVWACPCSLASTVNVASRFGNAEGFGRID